MTGTGKLAASAAKRIVKLILRSKRTSFTTIDAAAFPAGVRSKVTRSEFRSQNAITWGLAFERAAIRRVLDRYRLRSTNRDPLRGRS